MIIPPTSDSSTTLVLRRSFAAPRERVFRAWIEPRALERWMRPGGKAITVRSLDARVGGSFHFELKGGDSIFGTYLRVDLPEQLSFTWTSEAIQYRQTIITLNFLDQGPLTELILTHEGLSTEAMRGLVTGGWSTMLDALALALSSSHLD